MGRAKASTQWVVSKPVEGKLSELRLTIGGSDMKLFRLSNWCFFGLWQAARHVYISMIDTQRRSSLSFGHQEGIREQLFTRKNHHDYLLRMYVQNLTVNLVP